MTDFTIRALSASEVGEAIELWKTCGLTRPWNPPEADFLRAVTGESSDVLGAFVGGEIIGTVMVGSDGHRGWVYYLAVLPQARRQGLGAALMSSAEAWLTARGDVKLQLMVRGENVAVIDFYRSIGYEPQDVMVLGKRLPSA